MPTPFIKLSLSSPVQSGDNVREAQHALKDSKYGNFHPGKVDGHYGDHTAAAVRTAKYMLGFPKRKWKGPERFVYAKKLHQQLLGERKLGMVQRRRRNRRLSQAGRVSPGMRALQVARKQADIGVTEVPPDSNQTKYGKWYGENGVPWCAIFVSWCFEEAKPFFLFRWVRFKYAYCPFVVGDARAGRNGLRVVSWSDVRPGDLALYDWPGESSGTADHIGIVDKVTNRTSGTFQAIEGNTSATGSQDNGGAVLRKQRTTSLVQVFVRVSTVGDAA